MCKMGNNLQKPLITVVIPGYNVDPYIEKTILAVENQSYRNLEIILIDDGSTDNTSQIMDTFAYKDERIRVIHHHVCKGLSYGRNEGITLAKGQYLSFIDADDIVDPEYISAMLDVASFNDSDVVCCDFKSFTDLDSVQQAKNGIVASTETAYSGSEAVKAFYQVQKHGLSWVAWAKLYRTELFANAGVHYPEGSIHEDMAVTYRLIDTAKKVIYLDRVLYWYRIRQGSIMNSGFDSKHLVLLTFSRQAIGYFLSRHETDLADLATNYHIRISFTFLGKVKKEKTLSDREQKELLLHLRHDIHQYVDSGHLPVWKKAIFHLVARFPFQILAEKVGTEF